MIFLVHFRGKAAFERVVDLSSREIGLEGVSQIREHLGLEKLPLSVIDGTTASSFFSPRIKISEEEALRSEQFSDRNTIEVVVPHRGLNRFVEKTVKAEKADDGQILRAGLAWEIDNQAVINAWLEAGAPLKWDPDE